MSEKNPFLIYLGDRIGYDGDDEWSFFDLKECLNLGGVDDYQMSHIDLIGRSYPNSNGDLFPYQETLSRIYIESINLEEVILLSKKLGDKLKQNRVKFYNKGSKRRLGQPFLAFLQNMWGKVVFFYSNPIFL